MDVVEVIAGAVLATLLLVAGIASVSGKANASGAARHQSPASGPPAAAAAASGPAAPDHHGVAAGLRRNRPRHNQCQQRLRERHS